MRDLEIAGSGFDVLHNSKEWRIALHSFCGEVNGIVSFRQWGRHLDSEEAFVLLQGRAWLVTSGDGSTWDDCKVTHLSPDRLILVDRGERHAVILGEETKVLIIENLDMSNTVNEPIPEDVIRRIAADWEKGE